MKRKKNVIKLINKEIGMDINNWQEKIKIKLLFIDKYKKFKNIELNLKIKTSIKKLKWIKSTESLFDNINNKNIEIKKNIQTYVEDSIKKQIIPI